MDLLEKGNWKVIQKFNAHNHATNLGTQTVGASAVGASGEKH